MFFKYKIFNTFNMLLSILKINTEINYPQRK